VNYKLEFSGYKPQKYDFYELISTSEQSHLEQLNLLIDEIVAQIVSPNPDTVISGWVIGLSDRNDDSSLDCNARRDTEQRAARRRMNSAFMWIESEVSRKAAEAGVDAGDWRRSNWCHFGGVGAASGALKHDPPTLAQRALNRRVLVFAKTFPHEPEFLGILPDNEIDVDQDFLI
jgi:hypothetical protein